MKNIKISEQAHKVIVEFKKKYKFDTYSDLILQISEFFDKTTFHPKTTENESFTLLIKKLDERQNQRFDEILKNYKKEEEKTRGWIRKFEDNYMKGIAVDIAVLKQKSEDEDYKNNAISSDEKKENKPNDEVLKLQRKLDNAIESLKEKDEYIKQISSKNQDIKGIDEHKKILNLIQEKYKFESNSFGKERVVLNMKVDDFLKIFEIL